MEDLREELASTIRSLANHEDDYPEIEEIVDECMIIVKEYLNTTK